MRRTYGTRGTTGDMTWDWDEFCKVVIERWQKKLLDKDIFDTGTLYRSIVYSYRGVNSMNQLVQGRGNSLKAGTIPDMIAFSFPMYGIYVERGVGRGYARGNGGNLVKFKGRGRGRERRTWYYRIFANERHKVGEEVGRLYGKAAQSLIHTIESRGGRATAGGNTTQQWRTS